MDLILATQNLQNNKVVLKCGFSEMYWIFSGRFLCKCEMCCEMCWISSGKFYKN